MNEYTEYLAILRKLITILGDVTMSEAAQWLEVQANAEALRQEGHETDGPAKDQ